LNTVIKVENLSKKYIISHQKRERYLTLRDTIAQKSKEIGKRLLHPFISYSSQPLAGLSDTEEFWALKDISFEVQQGDRLGIIGRNGAGKSTLLKILSRITEPTTGKIRIKGRVSSLLEVGTGFHPELTGRENIFLNGAILGMGKTEIKKKFDEIVAFAEVEKFLDTPVKRYSSGMYVRLAFAVAAHLEPEIFIIDEVLAVGDASFQKKCLGKMEEVGKEGQTVLFVSHNMSAILNLCSRTIMLNSGEIIAEGTTEDIVRQYLQKIQEGTEQNISSTKERRGLGRVRFTRISFEDDNGALLEQAISGQPFVIVLDYQSKNKIELQNCRVSVAFYDNLGQALFNCSSELTSSDVLNLPSTGKVKCIIPKLPLSQSNYFINVFLEVNREIEDWIQGAVSLNVVDGDFFGTGKLYGRRWKGKGILVPHYWATENLI
jgi:lipopolysaccharide transport system ATP-binding protein